MENKQDALLEAHSGHCWETKEDGTGEDEGQGMAGVEERVMIL